MSDSNAAFQLVYDGTALASHEMDVKDLAPALIAMADLLEEANRSLNGNAVKVQINLKATEPGSVDIHLVIQQVRNIIGATVSLFAGTDVTAAVNAQALFQMVLNLFRAVKWQGGKTIQSVTRLEGEGFKLELPSGDFKIISESEFSLFKSFTVRRKLEAVVRTPLSRTGVDKVSLIPETQTERVEVTKEEADYFLAPEAGDEFIDEQEITTTLQIIGLSFQDGGKWRFTDGNAPFFAEILDKDFLTKIERNEASFSKSDFLKVVLIRRQSVGDSGIKTDYVIKNVIEHKSAARQIRLPLTPGG